MFYGLFPKRCLNLSLKSTAQDLSIVEDDERTTVRQNASSHRHQVALGTEVIETLAAWKVSPVSGCSDWLFAGIIATADPSQGGYGSSSAFGWAGGRAVYRGGANNLGLGGWVGWQTGDHAIFLLDTKASILEMYHSRTQTLHTLALPVENKQWRLHLNLHGQGDAVKLTIPTAEEEDAILFASRGA